MSGIAGIYNLDGRPVDRALLGRMTNVIAHRGPDGSGHWICDQVGLGHRVLHTTPESLQEKQPLVDDSGNLCLTLDGRVDNRDELITTLCVNGKAKEQITDAELILKAYEKWGEQCPQRLIGDFAFVIWDRVKQQLFCARDALGVKPFYYCNDGRRFLFASELHQIFEDSSIRREPNEGMIGEYLASAITNQEETLYRRILRLPPGHYLLVRPGYLRKQRYWDIDPTYSVRYQNDEQYAAHFLQLFKEAVRCRLRSHQPVGVYLSGGLDSSSVVGIAHMLYREEALPNRGFETFSMLFPGLACDESAYIRDVVRMWGIKCTTVSPEELNAPCYSELVHRYQDLPDYPNGATLDPLRTLAREKGVRVLLTGLGGDEWLTGSFYHYADLLRQFRILSLIRQIRWDSRVSGIIFPPFPVLRVGLWPLLPQSARQAIKRALRRRDRLPCWVDPQFARRTQLTERIRQEPLGRRFTSFAQGDLYKKLTNGWQTHSVEMEERAASWFGLEQRHPLNDRRIVEFALALPEEQRWRRDQPKYVLRQALRGFLPGTVRQRRTKADFSHLFAEALKTQGGERLFDSMAIMSMGWVDRARVRSMYQQMAQLYLQGDEGYITPVWPLWMVFGIELWFKTVFLDREIFPLRGLHIQEANSQSL